MLLLSLGVLKVGRAIAPLEASGNRNIASCAPAAARPRAAGCRVAARGTCEPYAGHGVLNDLPRCSNMRPRPRGDGFHEAAQRAACGIQPLHDWVHRTYVV